MTRSAPSPAQDAPGRRFVGREREIDVLRQALDAARAGHGGLVLLSGAPGIGKTRLAHEVVAQASAEEWRACWGRCWESGGAPPFWPWVEVLRTLTGGLDATALAARAGDGAVELVRLVPELRDRVPPASDASTLAPEEARFRLMDAVASFVRAVAGVQPLVLVLDDLHVADAPSLLLLRFLARDLRDAPLLVIGTYREREAEAAAGVGTLLDDIGREGQRLSLRGLAPADVSRLLAPLPDGDAAWFDAVCAATEGNPLFVTELGRLLAAGTPPARGAARVPDELRVIVRRRLGQLSPPARALIAVAAVLGREIELPVLQTVWPAAAAHVRDGAAPAVAPLLDETRALGLLETAGTGLRFAHVVFRDALYDDLPAPRRAALHQLAGEALAALAIGGRDAEIAHHFVQAGDVARGVAASRRAAARAQAQLAHEDAVAHLGAALDVLAQAPADAPERSDEGAILLALGDAQWGAGDLAGMRATFARAAARARTQPGPAAAALLADAALGFAGPQQRAHVAYEPDVVALLEEALAALPTAASTRRARVMARLAYALYLHPDSQARREALCREAVAFADASADDATRRWVLNDARWALWGPDTLVERRAIGARLLALAERLGDRELAVTEHAWRFVDQLELGDPAADDALATHRALAVPLQRPWYDWYVARFGALRALMDGRLADADRLAAEGLAAAQRVQHADALIVYGTLAMTLQLHQGRAAELDAGLQATMVHYPSVGLLRFIAAYLPAALDRREAARDALARVAARDFDDLPAGYLRLPAAAYVARLCAYVGDAACAASLLGRLLPYAEQNIVIGFGVVYLGAVAHHLALLAATTGTDDDARRWFEAALDTHRRLGARALLAHTRVEYGAFLRARGGDARRAEDLLAAAAADASACGLADVAARLDQIRTPPAPPATAGAPVRAVFRREGECWTVSFSSPPVQLRHLLGLHYIGQLLRHPGQAFHAAELVRSASGATDVADAGDAGELLDREALTAYRVRLRDLRAELAEAEADNDLGRSARMAEEIGALEGELSRALGLGGRARRASGAAERARVSVAKRIGAAVQKLATADPALGRYLAGTIRTGAFCVYDPDPGRPVTWEL